MSYRSPEIIKLACRESFDIFAQEAFKVLEPGKAYEWSWHIGCIAEHLMALRREEFRRLIINVPPRSLKSYLVSVVFPAWILGHNPTEKFIATSYSYSLAESLSDRCRYLVQSDWYRDIFPNVELNPSQNTKSFWQTTQMGQYYADSALGQITGFGCSYMVIDDPIDPHEGGSETIRRTTNENIRGTLFSRFDDKRIGKLVMIMQRIHEEDPTGHLLQDGGYTHLKLPAEAKRPVLITLGDKFWAMKQGDLLFPSRLSREVLDQARRDMGEYHYNGQMLQEPIPLGGGEFKDNWPKYYEGMNLNFKSMNIYILVDPAGGDDLNKKKRKSTDWTAMMVVGLAPDNNYYLLDIKRERYNPTERIETLFALHKEWNAAGGKPPKVGYERYSMQSDIHYINEKQKSENYRFPIVELGGRMMKEERIRRLIPDMENGRWYFPSRIMYTDNQGRTFNLVEELIKGEFGSFPRARYDDMSDALSRIYDEDIGATFPKLKLTGTAKKLHSMRLNQPQDWMSA